MDRAEWPVYVASLMIKLVLQIGLQQACVLCLLLSQERTQQWDPTATVNILLCPQRFLCIVLCWMFDVLGF